jgi:hypothetical protein
MRYSERRGICLRVQIYRPITAAARSKARNVFTRSNIGIVGSNPTQRVNVCVYSVFVLDIGLMSG